MQHNFGGIEHGESSEYSNSELIVYMQRFFKFSRELSYFKLVLKSPQIKAFTSGNKHAQNMKKLNTRKNSSSWGGGGIREFGSLGVT